MIENNELGSHYYDIESHRHGKIFIIMFAETDFYNQDTDTMESEINKPRANNNNYIILTSLTVCKKLLIKFDMPKNANTFKETATFAMTKVSSCHLFICFRTRLLHKHGSFLCSLLLSYFLPQFSVQGLNHSREAPACLVQVNVTHPQALAHRLLDRRAKQMRWMSLRAAGVEVQRADEQRAALLSASSPAGHGRS